MALSARVPGHTTGKEKGAHKERPTRSKYTTPSYRSEQNCSTGSRHVTLLDKWTVLQEIMAHPDLSLAAKVVAGVLLDCLNGKTGQCNPSVAVLAQRTARKRSVVCDALSELRTHGVVKQQRRRGSSAFEFLALPGAQEEVRDPGPLSADEVRDSGHVQVRDSGPLEIRDSGPLNPGIGNRESETRGKTPPSPSSSEIESGFAEWFEAYPVQYGKIPARREYERIIRNRLATHDELLSSVLAYAATRDGQDENYTKSPRNWLLDECWRDPPREYPQERGSTETTTYFDLAEEGYRP